MKRATDAVIFIVLGIPALAIMLVAFSIFGPRIALRRAHNL